MTDQRKGNPATRHQYTPKGYCPNCEYALDPGICPECGAHVSATSLRDRPGGWRETARRGVRRGIAMIIAAGALIFLWMTYRFGLINCGLPWGYWGEFNQARALLLEIPNVEIIGVRLNRDLTLEDFTFDIRVDGATSASLYYHEGQPDWELLKSAGAIAIIESKEVRCVPLGPMGPLDEVTGATIASGRDVLTHLAEIRAWLWWAVDDSLVGMDRDTCHAQQPFSLVISSAQAMP